MLLTITLNPAIDKKYLVKSHRISSVHRVINCVSSAGGKGLNVARVAVALGEPVVATGFLGGFSGKIVEELLNQEKFAHDFEKISQETRTCINILEENGSTSTEFLETGPMIFRNEWENFLKKFDFLSKKVDVITISGSVSPGLPETACAELIKISKKNGKIVLFDSSGAQLQHGINEKPTLIKPNFDEISVLLGHEISDYSQFPLAVHHFFETGIPYVVISLGKDGALLCCEAGNFWGIAPEISVKNTVGCGDSMIAAFAVALKNRLSPPEMLRYAVAVSAASALHPDTGCFAQSDFEGIFPKVTVQTLP